MPVKHTNIAPTPAAPSIVPRLLRIPQAAQYLGATNWCVEELVRDGKIPFLTVGKYRVIDIRDLDEWIDAEKEAQSVQASKAA